MPEFRSRLVEEMVEKRMKIETTLGQMGLSYDWEDAFKYAQGDSVRRFDKAMTSVGVKVCGASYTLDDVQEVLASAEGENDGDSWIALFRLKDGRFAFLSAGCDYTGWG